MKSKTIFSVVSSLALGLFVLAFVFASIPSLAKASTYAYVNTSGNVAYVEANSVAGAFANAINIASNSGVMLTNITTTSGTNTNSTHISGYLYVNTSGQVIFVDASSPAEALSKSQNIADNSGVMMISSVSDQNLIGDSVSGV